jgi:hypothetical protein
MTGAVPGGGRSSGQLYVEGGEPHAEEGGRAIACRGGRRGSPGRRSMEGRPWWFDPMYRRPQRRAPVEGRPWQHALVEDMP